MLAVFLAVVMSFSGLMMFASTFSVDDAVVDEVEGKMWDKRDDFGYTWVDNNEPGPKIEFDWIDCTKGEKLDIQAIYYDHVEYDLPFEFPFYGEYYESTIVYVGGFLSMDLDFSYQYFSYLYNQMPFSQNTGTYYAGGLISAWGNYVGGYAGKDQEFAVYVLEGETYGEKWVAFEWNKAQCYAYTEDSGYQITFEVILYEGGLIKMQWLDATSDYTFYSNGAYSNIGIENLKGTDGISYNYNQAKIWDGLAVFFGSDLAEVDSITLDTETSGSMLPRYRDYTATVRAKHPVNNDMIRNFALDLGDGLAQMNIFIDPVSGGLLKYEVDPNEYIIFNTARSRIEYDDTGEWMLAEFVFTPTFLYPFTTFQKVGTLVSGQGIIPTSHSVKDSYWVNSEMMFTGSLRAESEFMGFVENGGWMRAKEVFHFTGFRPVYYGTMLSPQIGGVTVIATDQEGIVWEQTELEETGEPGKIGDYVVEVQLEDFLATKRFNLTIGSIPEMRDLSSFAPYVIRIDPFKPSPPLDVYIHADGYDDPTVSFDDDQEVFVTWEPGQDMESGIYGHFLSQHEPGSDPDDVPVFIRYPVSSARFELSEPGLNRIYVWAVDRAGMTSSPTLAFTKIDTSPVVFSEFSPGHQVWVNTRTPVCSVLIDDGDGSGIASEFVEYSFSTSSVYEYGPWMRVPGIRDGLNVRASITETFVSGKENFIRFRAMDIAGNGWTESGDYNVWVDVDSPVYSSFRPTSGEYQDSSNVIISLNIHDSSGGHEGSGVIPDSIEHRFSTGGKGLYGDWYLSPINSYESGVFHIEMEMDFAEGTENFIQFRCLDSVGNTIMSPDFNIKVNSAPSVSSFISSPIGSTGYTSDEKIYFDASGTLDPDGDDLGFLWYSDLEGFLSGRSSFYRSLNPGLHVITLIVNDPSHSMVEYREILILEASQVDPSTVDSDGDGLYDAWELMYNLDPLAYDSQLDVDHDTFTNLQEYQNGTDPSHANSHPPYGVIDPGVEVDENEDSNDQYRVLTVTLGLISLIVVLVLIFLAFSKRRNFRMEVDEERDLEVDEQDYRKSISSRRSRSLDIGNKGGL
ncbi:MAG: hypothetical protein KAH57_09930 [Thermoplasmata archaeon]|nr:hypothetical protein [Thermoplasmata archaeon]